MLKSALKVLQTIEEHGFCAYIVGGFVRDYYLGISSLDVDICTNATPMQIRSIFHDACMPRDEYGSICVRLKNYRFDITTFRREYTYYNNRKPIEFEYIEDLFEDLQRRDFTVNTLCLNRNGDFIDLLGGMKDLNQKVIRTVGDPYTKFSEDSLRILRAVRFATILDFELSEQTKEAIIQTKRLLKMLSYQRKRQELDKIFSSSNVKRGISLLLELGLDQELELFHLSKVNVYDDLLGIWTILQAEDKYPFTKNEKDLIHKIRSVLSLNNFDPFVLYHYGPYVNSVACTIKGIPKRLVTEKYDSLPIKSKVDICLSAEEILSISHKKPGPFLKELYVNIEHDILNGTLQNDPSHLQQYIIDHV